MYLTTHARTALPAEILFLILEQIILDSDIFTLKALSAVSKIFHPSCRKHLFRRISITISSDRRYDQAGQHAVDSFLEFAEFLTSNPRVLKSIRRLVLLEVSCPPSLTLEAPSADEEDVVQRWRTVAAPLTRILEGIESLQSLEIRSDAELDWASFDAGVKRALYTLLRRTACADAAVRLAALRGVSDADLLALVIPCADVALTQVRFDLNGTRSTSFARQRSAPSCGNPADIKQAALCRLRLGREMGMDALDWLVHHPESLAGVRYLTMESLSCAAALEDMWKFVQGTRHALEHLEWWLEDLAFRETADLTALQQIDLSVFPQLRSLVVRSSQLPSGTLVNLMVILESTGPTNTIEELTIVMPSSIDKYAAFQTSMAWKRLDDVFASPRFQRHLRAVVLSFAWTNQPLQQRTVDASFSAFKRNLPSLRGKNLSVSQRRARAF